MSTETPPIAERVATRRAEMGLSQAALARRVGVAQQSIQQLEAGQVDRPRYLLDLARALSVAPEWLLGLADTAAVPAGVAEGQQQRLTVAAHRARDLPVLGVGVGGDDVFFETNGQVHEYVERPSQLDAVHNAYAIYMTGDSMEPRYFAGEIVYVNPNRPVTPGSFVVVELTDGRGMVKRLVRRTDRRIVLEQFNPARHIELARDTVRHVHRIVQAGEP